MKGKVVGLLLLGLIIAVAWFGRAYYLGKPVVVVKGFVGGEKSGLLEDPDVQQALRARGGMRLDYAKAGSIEMVTAPHPGSDFLWPSSQMAFELYKSNHADQLAKGEIIFNSPIVLYSWDLVVDALVKAGLAREQDSVYYLSDFRRLADMIMAGAKWSDIGLKELYGRITVTSTDPNKSNSGAVFAGLLANVLHNDVLDDAHVDSVIPLVKKFFTGIGFMEHSSSDLFMQYLSTGVGAKPIIVGYESQIIEFSIQHADKCPSVKKKVRVLYPEPTVWTSHPVIALDEKGANLIKALLDTRIQQLAWEKHGFRTGMIGVQNDPRLLQVVGIPAQITKVMPLPDHRIMGKILAALSTP
jgi:hypothetical protein